jgi:predicted ester cyclase
MVTWLDSKKQAEYSHRVWNGEISPVENKTVSRGRPLSNNEMKDAIVRLFDEANRVNFDVFDEMFAPDFISYGGAGFQDLKGAHEFRDLMVTFMKALPDLIFRVDLLVAEGNLIGVRGTLSGTHEGNFMGMAPATHKFVSWTGTAIFQFNNQGLMDARWQEWDGLEILQQLGAIPAPASAPPRLPDPTPPYYSGGPARSDPNWRLTSPVENKAIVRRFIEEVWNKGNLAVADEVFHPQATSPSAPQLPVGPEGVKILARMFHKAMPDYRIEIIDLLADGDLVLARFTQSGTQQGELMGIPPTGKKATWGEIGILRFAGGRIVESWYNVDMLALMQQLGLGGASVAA